MTSDGKLEIHTNAADKESPERKKRYQDWKDRLEEVKNPKKSKEKPLFEKGPNQ
jgi:hypothetical protein